MTLPETIFTQALTRLEQGESPTQIAQDYPNYQEELLGLLAVAKMGLNIPHLTPPTPYKQFRFADKVIASSGFMQFLGYFKVAAIPIGLVIVLLGGKTALTATENSLPGDTLYSIKRASEEARLTLTRDQEKVVAIHVELLQKRLEEVRKAADTGNEAKETAALAELQSQSKVTFAEATPVATANAISKQDSSLLNTLVAVNKEQKDVLSSLSTNGEASNAKTLAMNAIDNNKQNEATLAKIIATVNDQTLADLPNKTTVTGIISLLSNNKITVEKNTFTINEHTIITGTNGEAITDIKTVTGRVTIAGTRIDDGSLIAKQISVLPVDGTVKGSATTNTPTKKPVTKPSVSPTNEETTEPEILPTQDPEPTKAIGNYITEPSSPQYSQ